MKLFASITIASLVASAVAACQVPVFRYALERWEADPYAVMLFHDGPMTAEQQEVLDFLGARESDAETIANIYVGAIDVSVEAESEAMSWYRAQEGPQGPLLAAFYPAEYGELTAAWSGPLTMARARELVDSPARRELIRRIAGGDAAVWLLLDSGDADADAAAERMIEDAATVTTEEIPLPEGVMTVEEAENLADGEAEPGFGFDPSNVLRSKIPLTTEFSVLRIGAEAEGETGFREMLLNQDPRTAGGTDVPVAYVVFGQGRALGPLVGEEIQEEVLLDAAYYVCGACSCEVKAQNPGFDLLMTANWWDLLDGNAIIEDRELPPLEGAADLIADAAPSSRVDAASGPVAAVEVVEPEVVSPTRTVAITVIVLAVVLGLATALIVRRAKD